MADIEYNDSKFEWDEISCGVPKDSILGSLMFLLYIIYLYYATDKLILYIDDTNLIILDTDLTYLKILKTKVVLFFVLSLNNYLCEFWFILMF